MPRKRSPKNLPLSSLAIEQELAKARSELSQKKSGIEALEKQLRQIKDSEKAVFFDVILDATKEDIDFAQKIIDIAEKDTSNRKEHLKNWTETIRSYHAPKQDEAATEASNAVEKTDDELLAEMEAEEQKANSQANS